MSAKKMNVFCELIFPYFGRCPCVIPAGTCGIFFILLFFVLVFVSYHIAKFFLLLNKEHVCVCVSLTGVIPTHISSLFSSTYVYICIYVFMYTVIKVYIFPVNVVFSSVINFFVFFPSRGAYSSAPRPVALL